jgi:hypothetical protein
MQKAFFLILLIHFSINGFAQYKYEREIRIRENDVPANALQFVDSLNFNSNIRWYKEIGENRISFEAKTRYKGERYSIEFSDNGIFEDMEIEMSPEEIPFQVFNRITEFLQSELERYAIEKIQIQYSGNTDLILAQFRNRETMQGVDVHYEIVISTRLEGSFLLFEYLFSETGEFVKKARIVEKSINNIIY